MEAHDRLPFPGRAAGITRALPALRTTNQAPPFMETACQIDAIRGAPPRLSLGNLPGKKLAMRNVREVICERRKHLL